MGSFDGQINDYPDNRYKNKRSIEREQHIENIRNNNLKLPFPTKLSAPNVLTPRGIAVNNNNNNNNNNDENISICNINIINNNYCQYYDDSYLYGFMNDDDDDFYQTI